MVNTRICGSVKAMRWILVSVAALRLYAADPIVRLDGFHTPAEQLDAKIAELMREAKVTGLGVAVVNGGKIVYLKAHGVKNTKTGEPLTTETVMAGASFTKSAFAYLVMQLVEENTLSLDRPISAYLAKSLPEYPEYRDLAGDERWKKLTSRMLLSHTPGFSNWRMFTDDKKLRIHFEPGSRYAYSGEGIRLLQQVVEESTGEPVAAMMKKRIFDRFGMKRTSLVWDPAWEGGYAHGYNEDGSDAGFRKRMSANAAGSMCTTIEDWTRFLTAILRGEGLSSAGMNEMLRPQIRIRSKEQFPTLRETTTSDNDKIDLAYGLGWGLFQSPVGKAFFKEGHDDGWENHSVCFLGPKTCVVLMANSSNGDKIFKELLEFAIGDRWTPWKWEGYIPHK